MSYFENDFINPLISVCERARMDERYRSKVLSNLKTVLRQVGCKVPSHLRVFVKDMKLVVQEKEDSGKKISIPLTTQVKHRSAELTERELDQVSAGAEFLPLQTLKYQLSLLSQQC